jgi:hypothetical protein
MSSASLPPGDLASAAILFFAFVIGHAVGDFPLQSDFMARGKNRHTPPPCFEAPKRGLWVYCLSAHALTHAGIVWVITRNPFLGFAEFVLHWAIDFLRTEGKTNFHTDQGLHIACKVLYVGYLFL